MRVPLRGWARPRISQQFAQALDRRELPRGARTFSIPSLWITADDSTATSRTLRYMSLIPRADLRRRGVSDGEVRAAVRSGSIVPVRRGVYVDPATTDLSDDRTRRLLELRAAVLSSDSDLVVSHSSAALVHGIDLWPDIDRRAHLTANRSGGGRAGTSRVVHASPLHPDDVTTVDGVRVTSLARTVVDLACSRPFESSVCSGDAALRRTSADDLAATLARAHGRRGIDRARRAIAFMDGGAESVGESRSRVYLHRHGLPAPALQCDVLDERGRFVGRPDFLFDGVIGEFDGLAKYREYGDAADVVIAEKLREDRLRSLEWRIERWTWNDLATSALADRLRAALTAAEGRAPLGSTRRHGTVANCGEVRVQDGNRA
ncbi:type IV toxin-antitoxin system AbiEi family antitoxin domain-containing protein [Rhodococcus sp. NBC_00294]|uniref:type IV toxin-antitoxin system AbiEi family antitoxin domain-containing protein n=1 Tax=Rhodococcus sp. NBC_00294 TaxID=2976004 RepID=UPI002E2DF61E|nr:type IV toxin-antitoxin system AbiEi family antitoxin domain-containing protein [Rhodococcus sp. NBC_00294]